MSYFDECTTKKEVKTKWRELSRAHHPDRGGNPAEFDVVAKAYHRALKRVEAAKCEVCDGTGKVTVNQGFSSIKMPCSACKGSGKP